MPGEQGSREQGSDVEHQGAGGTGFRRNKVPMLNIKVLGNKVPGNKVPRNIVPMIKVTEEQGSGTSYGLCHIMTQYHLASLVPDI